MRNTLLALLTVMSLATGSDALGLSDSTTLEFTNQRVRCLFTMRVFSTIPPDSLENLVFDYDNLCEFSKEVSVIRLLEKRGDSAYVVEFTLRYLLNEMVSTWLRARHADGRITIDMLSTRQTISVLPYVTRMSAGFTFTKRGPYTVAEYHQDMSLSWSIEWIHFMVVKRKLRGYARDFERFVRAREIGKGNAVLEMQSAD